MKRFYSIIENKIKDALNKCNYNVEDVMINDSNRPDLGEYQYNGIMHLAKIYHKNPIEIASTVVNVLKEDNFFCDVNVAGPGFINLSISNDVLIEFTNKDNYEYPKNNKLIFFDYGGANVAKSLHVGHLRSANIGEALKRLCEYLGYKTISDTHLGDWGRPLGLVIYELSLRNPDWPFFQSDYQGEYPKVEITSELLEEVYPYASSKAKENEEYLKMAQSMTKRLQNKEKGIYDLWLQIMEVSKKDIKNIYDRLNAKFDLYKGESNAEDYVPELLRYLDKLNIVEESEGAKVINVKEDSDTKEMPPMLLLKSDGGLLYSTTELATLYDRIKNYKPDEIWYVADKRQELHFTQVFRAAYKANIAKNEKLVFAGFGTMNSKDGKPFKTRDGGVMRLIDLLDSVKNECLRRLNPEIKDNRDEIADKLAIATLKYADMLPSRETDYNFDLEKFCDLDGKTGPYIVYSTIRMKSLLNKVVDANISYSKLKLIVNEYDKALILSLNKFDRILNNAFNDKSLNAITDYLYELSTNFNRFYTECHVLNESDKEKQESWAYLTSIVYKINKILLNILAIDIPDRM